MKYTLLFFFLLLFSSKTISQKNTWLSLIGAVNYDHYTIKDPEGYIAEKPIISGMAGMTVEKELNDILSLGSGVIYKSYSEGIRYKNSNSYSFSTAFNSLLLPIFAKAGRGFQDELFRLSIEGGGSIGFNLFYSEAYPNTLGGRNSTVGSGFVISDTTSTDGNKKLMFYTFYFGGNIQFKILKVGRIGLSVHRHFGVEDLISIDVEYSVSSGDPFNATAISKGGFTTTALSISYPINLLFKKP